MSSLDEYEILDHVADDPPWRLYTVARVKGTHPYRTAETEADSHHSLILRKLTYKPVEREEQEAIDAASVATTFRHPNIEEVLEWSSRHRHCIQPFRLGWRLHLLVEEDRPFPPAAACLVVRQLCRGLGYLHSLSDPAAPSMGVVHGDVRVHTVLVTTQGEVLLRNPALRLKRSGPELASFDPPKVYSRFSPEHASDQPLCPASDIFQLGLLLDEMLTGSPLFQRGPAFETLSAIKEESIPPISTRGAEIPKAFDTVVSSALAKSPADRLSSVAELDETLRGIELDEGWEDEGITALRQRLENESLRLRPRINGYL